MDPDHTAPLDQCLHCLPVCKNRFEKFARIFSRRHKQMTFSDAVCFGILKIRVYTVHTTGFAEKVFDSHLMLSHSPVQLL